MSSRQDVRLLTFTCNEKYVTLPGDTWKIYPQNFPEDVQTLINSLKWNSVSDILSHELWHTDSLYNYSRSRISSWTSSNAHNSTARPWYRNWCLRVYILCLNRLYDSYSYTILILRPYQIGTSSSWFHTIPMTPRISSDWLNSPTHSILTSITILQLAHVAVLLSKSWKSCFLPIRCRFSKTSAEITCHNLWDNISVPSWAWSTPSNTCF